MRLGCPQCGAWFDVADERAADPSKSVTCPECLEVFAVKEAKRQGAVAAPPPDDEADFGFELDGLSRAGLSRVGGGEEGGRSGDASRISLSNVMGERSAPGFDSQQPESTGEVSSLRDVDLSLAGTYHRTGRKLHHATDVVWTGRGNAAPPPAAPPPKLPPIVTRSAAPPAAPPGARPVQPPARPEPSRVPPKPVVAPAPPPPALHSDSQGFAEPGFDDFPPIESSVVGSSQRLGMEADDISTAGFEGSLTGGLSGVRWSGTNDRFSVSNANSSVAGRQQSGSLDEMDFSSLLEDSLSSKSAFGRDNPFADIGLGEQSLPGAPPPRAAPPPPPPPDLPTGGRRTGRIDMDQPVPKPPVTETGAFFVDAPAAGSSLDMGLGGSSADSISSSFDVDIPGAGGPRGGAADPKKATKAVKSSQKDPSAQGKGGKGPVVALVLLVLIAGVGIAGEALDYGYFFVGLLDAPESGSEVPGDTKPPPAGERLAGTPRATPGGPAVEAPKDDLPPAGDTPQSYDARLQAIDKALAAETNVEKKVVLQDEQLRLQLQFRFRWPGRFLRDEARKTGLEATLSKNQKRSYISEFWEVLGQPATADKTRDTLLDRAARALTMAGPDLTTGQKFFYEGLVAHERKKPADALQLLDLAVAEQPDLAWAQLERGASLLEEKRFDDAVASAELVLKDNANSHDARLLLARSLVAKQDDAAYERAKEVVVAALKAAKDSGDVYGEYEVNLIGAQLYGLLGKTDERRTALEAASAFDPKEETLVIELAETDQRAGELKKASERLGACPPEVCKSIEFVRVYVKVLKATDNLQEAEARTVKAEFDFPGNPEVLYLSADVLETRGKLSLAAKKFEAVKAKDPKYLEAYLRLAQIYRREKDYDKAIRVLDEAAKTFEGAGSETEAALAVAQERGELLIKQGRADEAKTVFTQIVKARPTNAPARLSLATILVELGQHAVAVQHFEKLAELGKSGPEMTLPFAKALIASGKPDRAIEELKTFLETNPKDLDTLVELGHAYVQKELFSEARVVLEYAVTLNRNFAPAYFYAGQAEFGHELKKAENVEARRKAGETTFRDEEKPHWDLAVVAFTNARDRDPENLLYREMLARALTESGSKRELLSALEQYDTIMAAYRKADRGGPKLFPSAEVYYNRGLLASKLGRPRDEVLKNFQDALLLDSERADYIARYGEELYRMQSRQQQGDRYVLEAKAYFELVRQQFSNDHVRSNYYLGKIALLEWGKQAARRPNDPLHKLALDYFQQVNKVGGENEFPDVLFQIANVFRDLEAYRLSDIYYGKYLETYRKLFKRAAPNERHVRELMKNRTP